MRRRYSEFIHEVARMSVVTVCANNAWTNLAESANHSWTDLAEYANQSWTNLAESANQSRTRNLADSTRSVQVGLRQS